MSSFLNDTIAAPITAPGRGAVAVVRISGTETRRVLSQITPNETPISNPRKAITTSILAFPANRVIGEGGSLEVLDHGIVVFFPGPNSFTGEDCAEVSLHGNPYLLSRFLDSLAQLGVRGARPGEFSERAFLNGKIDLTQAEAIADLISAETEAQLQVAREQLEGKLAHALTDLGEPLRNLLAEIEAGIDFPEEGIDPLTYTQWSSVVSEIASTVDRYLESFRTGRVCREGANVVLAGLPNAGKSSVLNRLVGEERAIVTPIAGTTRDSIEERISLDGIFIRLWDTAGLASEEHTPNYKPDPIELVGIEQSWKRIRSAEIVLFIYDPSRDVQQAEALYRAVKKVARTVFLVPNKIDLIPPTPLVKDSQLYPISALTGAGFSELKAHLVTALVGTSSPLRGDVMICTQRHYDALSSARRGLTQTLKAIGERTPSEFIAASIRSALGSLNEIVGVTTTEDLLGRIFSKFCIGK